jgi:ParB family chromosome partitioning protein
VPRESRFRHSFEAPIDSIEPDPSQARKYFSEADIAELASTMVEQGQLQPILLRRDPARARRWIIVAGERRWRAAQCNGWTSILAIEHNGDAELASLVENLQRVDLNAVEEARGLQRLISGKGWSQAEAARLLGKSKAVISGLLRILSLPKDVLETVASAPTDLPKNVLIELARIEDPRSREKLLGLARAGELTIRAIRSAASSKDNAPDLAAIPSPPTKEREVKRAGMSAVAERLAAKLRSARLAELTLDDDERRSLLSLQEEIEKRLAGIP